jgi:hypothetical protein
LNRVLLCVAVNLALKLDRQLHSHRLHPRTERMTDDLAGHAWLLTRTRLGARVDQVRALYECA